MLAMWIVFCVRIYDYVQKFILCMSKLFKGKLYTFFSLPWLSRFDVVHTYFLMPTWTKNR
jgi:hypothetical protein